MLEAGDSISSPSFSLPLSVVLSDVVTKPDCNCLYPKATPSSDLASVSPQQPLAPSMAPMAGLTWADSEGTEGSSLLPSEQPLRTVDLDPRSAKQRPPRSTCQSFESPELPGVEASPVVGDSPQPRPSVGAPVPGMEDILDSALGTNWTLEEASGEASEVPVPQGAALSSSRLGGGRVQAETTAGPSDLSSAPFPQSYSARGEQPEDMTGVPLPTVGPARPTGQAQSHTPEKTDRPSAPPRDHQEPSSARTPSRPPRGLRSPSALSAQPNLPRRHSWGHVLPLGELEGRRSTRDRRSPTELEGRRASEGAAGAPAPFNSVPLTDTGHERQQEGPSDPQLRGFTFHLLVPSITLLLLAVGGLLFYRWRRRVRRAPERGGQLMGTAAQPGQRRSSRPQDYLGSAWVLRTPRWGPQLNTEDRRLKWRVSSKMRETQAYKVNGKGPGKNILGPRVGKEATHEGSWPRKVLLCQHRGRAFTGSSVEAWAQGPRDRKQPAWGEARGRHQQGSLRKLSWPCGSSPHLGSWGRLG